MSTRRPAITAAQLRRMLEALASVGIAPKRIELSPHGGVILHTGDAPPLERDLLTEWEAHRGSRPH